MAWPPCPPALVSLDFLLWSYIKDQVCSQRVNTLNKLKAQIGAATANVTTIMLQCVWQDVDYR
jgi:hypothetical protein